MGIIRHKLKISIMEYLYNINKRQKFKNKHSIINDQKYSAGPNRVFGNKKIQCQQNFWKWKKISVKMYTKWVKLQIGHN